ncbi:unnamed protein product, partial [marine sediment metagenome]
VFSTPNCTLCLKVKKMLEELKKLYPRAEIREMDIVSEDALALNKALCARAYLPTTARAKAPAVFSANRGLVGDDITLDALKELAERARGLAAPWELRLHKLLDSDTVALEQYMTYTPLVIIGAGLADGINPCAYAAIIFFITYLTYIKKSRAEILLAGLLFISAVFVTYLAIGVALYGLLRTMGEVSVTLNRILYSVMALLLAVAVGLSLGDGIRCLQGRPQQMKLKLP